MSLTAVAKATLRVIDEGGYTAPSGRWVSIEDEVRAAVEGTSLFTPDRLAALPLELADPRPPTIEVSDETTQAAAYRLVHEEGVADLVLLNYASAKNAGGGFLKGAKAQEEDLARCSALYPCLMAQPRYYEANRGESSLLYTDHIIYSPRVPFFRVHSRDAPIESPYLCSVITAPAPNAGEVLRRDRGAGPSIREALHRRARYVLAVAAARGHSTLLLGAWGCGVFRNDPSEVAEAFAAPLARSAAFSRVVFAVPKGSLPNHEVFAARFADGA